MSPVTEFDFKGLHYRRHPLNVRVQQRIVRRLLRLAEAISPASRTETLEAIQAIRATVPGGEAPAGSEPAGPSPERLLQIAIPFFGSLGAALAELSDADQDYITDRCLEAIQRQTSQAPTWAPIVASNGELMFSDLTAADSLYLTLEVLRENIGPFFTELLGHWFGARASRPPA